MTDRSPTLESIVTQAMQLSPIDKVHLIERLVSGLGYDLEASKPAPKRSLWGLCADLGSSPSAEEIDEARREAWSNFPRDDI